MRITKLTVIFALLLSCSTSLASPDIQHWVTKNGVQAYFIAAPELPMIDIALTFNAGSDRDNELAGLSRLTHSLLNTGTKNLDADEIAEKFENVGAQFSASVSLDRSSISLRSLTDKKLFQQALSTYITVITQPSFPVKDFERLKKQALIAIKDSEQRPGDIATRSFYKKIYGEHPYSQPTLGYKESIEKITLDDVKKYHQKYIVSENAIIAMVGGVELKQAKKIANKIALSLTKGEKPLPIAEPKKLLPAENIFVPFPSQQAHVYLGHLGIKRGDPDYFILYTGNHVLGGGGFTSRLVKEVRVERGLSYSVYSYFYPTKLNGPFVLGLQTRTDQAQEAVDVSLETIKKFLEEGPSDEELTLSKSNIIGGFPLRIDNNRDKLGYLSLIGYYNLPLNYLDTFTDKISAVTKEDIVKAFEKHLQLNNMVEIIVGGQEGK